MPIIDDLLGVSRLLPVRLLSACSCWMHFKPFTSPRAWLVSCSLENWPELTYFDVPFLTSGRQLQWFGRGSSEQRIATWF